MSLKHEEILPWLLEKDEGRLEELWRRTDQTREENVGPGVHIGGLIEFSNVCVSHCHHCGLRSGRRALSRYRMTEAEILGCAAEAANRGYGAVVLQSGQDPWLEPQWISDIVRRIKGETALSVTLACEERPRETLAAWREAGADRYLLRFETSDRSLWQHIHPQPGQEPTHRFEILDWIRGLGYETGSGIMVGVPGQTWATLAEDLEWFRRLDLDMVGIAPYMPHPETPAGRIILRHLDGLPTDQVPNDELTTYKALALARLVCPRAGIPSAAALAAISPDHGRELGLKRGANFLLLNLTPAKYRLNYETYPAKSGADESASDQQEQVARMLAALGRTAGSGPGFSPNYLGRSAGGAEGADPGRRGST